MIEEEVRPEDRAFLKKIYRVRQTLASMIRQRGYNDPSNQLQETESFEEFQLKYSQNQDHFSKYLLFFKVLKIIINNMNIKPPDFQTKLAVKFAIEQQKKNLTDGDINTIIEKMQQTQVNNVILIVNGDPAAVIDKKARTKIDEINSMHTYSCQVFNMDDLVFDITKHELVPQHIPICDKDKKSLLDKYRLTEAQLPRILLQDPVAKFLGLKHGDVVKIIRKSETAGIYVTYRIAI